MGLIPPSLAPPPSHGSLLRRVNTLNQRMNRQILAKKFGVKKEQQKATGKRKADGGKGAAKPAAPSSSALDEVQGCLIF